MTDIEKKILVTIDTIGPTFISKLANRILENQNEVRECVRHFVKEKILERVENIMVSYKTKDDNVVVKHRNHTYYQLTKKGKRLVKEIEVEDFEVREAFKTYNKALQNSLDNSKKEIEEPIYAVIDFPFSQENNVKNILKDTFNLLEKTYDKTVTLRGKVHKEKLEELKNNIFNIVVLDNY